MKEGWLVVGAGFTGATVAERLATVRGERVTVCDVHPYVGGTAADYVHESGLLLQHHGPHVFHTSSGRVWEYIRPFAEWRRHRYTVAADIGGQLIPMPLGFRGIELLFGERAEAVKEALLRRYGPDGRISVLSMAREEGLLRELAEVALERLYVGYTRKHWGREPAELGHSVLARVPIVVGNQPGYHRSPVEAYPTGGYTRLVQTMLSDQKIEVLLGTSYEEVRQDFPEERTIYTGPVDAFFGYVHGRLPYRSVRFRVEMVPEEHALSYDTINHPLEHDYTRVVDAKRITGERHPHSALIYDYPEEHDGSLAPLYPVPSDESSEIFARYQALMSETAVSFAGRLGDYCYYDMDQAIGSGLALAERLSAAL